MPRPPRRWEYSLASDCIFNEELFKPLIDTLLSLTSASPGGAGAAAGCRKGGDSSRAAVAAFRTDRYSISGHENSLQVVLHLRQGRLRFARAEQEHLCRDGNGQ